MTMSLYHWRAFIGPAYAPRDAADHYQWPDLWNFAIDPSAAHTTLAADLASGATSATLASGSALVGTGGGVWIGPNGTGQGWEYVGYTGISSNTMSGLIREPTAYRAHDGVHTSGAVVRQWWEIAGADGRLHFAEQIDANLSAITWTAEIAGIRAEQPAMRANHLIVIQTRADLGAWANTLIGFCRQPRVRDTYERLREWSLEIVCAAQIIDGYRSKSIRVGAMNLAAAGGASTDTPLADPTKERTSGDFIASAPDLTGASAIDADAETLWIAERLRGTARSLELTTDEGVSIWEGGFITGARIWRYPGEPRGHRYFEFVAPAVGGLRTWPSGWLCSKDHANAVIAPFESLAQSAGDLIILAESKAVFEAANPLSTAVGVFEIPSSFFDGLDPAGDAVALRIMRPGGGNFYPTVAWGTGGTPERMNDGSHEYGGEWDTDTIALPDVGEIIRYNYYGLATLKKEHFIVDAIDAPGYRTGGDDPWLQIALPVIGLANRDDISATVPANGSKLYTTKGDADGTEGLTASGTIQIGMEQINYSARHNDGITVSGRAANGTTAAEHAAGDLIRIVDTDGIATQGQLINRVGWSRPAGKPYPEGFKIRATNLDSARVPPDENHTEDYTLLVELHDHAANTYSLDLDPAIRVTHLLMEIDHMSADPYRPRVNEIEADADIAAFDSTLVMAADDPETIVDHVIQSTGWALGAISVTAGSMVLDQLITAEDDGAWRVAADIAAKTNVLLDCARTGYVAISTNTLPAGTLSAATTWTDITAAACEFVQTAATPLAQIRLPWRSPTGSTAEARYPTEPTHAAGQILTLAEARYPNDTSALAAAQRAFIMARYPATLIVECAEEQPAMRPGAVARVQWTFADDQPQLDRLVIVTAADHEIDRGIWTTVLTCQQVDREWPA